MASNPNWKTEPFSSINDWMDQCHNCVIVRDGDKLHFGNNQDCISCAIVADKQGKELFVPVGYFFPNGSQYDKIHPNCGWTQ